LGWVAGLAVAITLSSYTLSSAADLEGPKGGSYKDTSYEAPAAFSFAGFYVGGHAGVATGNTEGGVEALGPFIAALTATDYDMNGGTYGLHAGYNYQRGNLVFGVEGDYSWADIQGNSTCVVLLNCERELDWTASIVGRVGYAAGRTMFYAKGGAVWGELSTDELSPNLGDGRAGQAAAVLG